MDWNRIVRAVALGSLLAGMGVAMSGCQSNSGFSKEEEKQIREGPPAQMPPEAQKAMERMRQGGGNVPPPPPRPKGQPGPGAPFGPQ